MKITRIEIGGFGRLRDFRADIAPGLHIFFGPNEAGKSHIQQAILALLYGFYQGNRARKDESELRERYAPWDGGAYAGRLEYELSDSRRFRIDRDFSDSDQPTTIWSLENGLNVTDQFGRGRHGNVPFAQEHLGMTRRVFESCAFVSQGELFQIADEAKASPQEIGETIVRLADTASRDVSARSALAQLDKVLREEVGGPTARTTPMPLARRRLEDLRAELAGIDRIRAEVAEDAERLENVKSQVLELRLEVVRSRYLLAQAEVAELRTRLRQIEQLSTRETELHAQMNEHASFATFPVEERDDVLTTWERIRGQRESLDGKRDEIEQQRRQLDELNTNRQALIQRERELAHMRDFPINRKPDIDQLMSAARETAAINNQAQSRLEAAAAQAEPVVEEYKSLHVRVGHLTSADIAQVVSRLAATAAAGSLGTFVNALLRAIRRALRWLWRQTVAAARWLWRTVTRQPAAVPVQEPPPSATPTDTLSVSPDEAGELLTLHARYREIAPLVEKHQGEREAAEHASQRLAAAEQALRDRLTNLVEDTSDLKRAYRIFIERTEQREELDDLTERISSNDRERSACTRAIESFEADKERLERQEIRLHQRLEEATDSTGDLASLIQAFDEGCRRRRLYEETKRELSEIEERRGIILEGRSPQELQELARRYEQDRERLLPQHPWLAGAQTGDSREALQDRLTEQESELKRLEVEIGQLSATIDTKQRDVRPRAEGEEEIAGWEAELAALEGFRDELKIAIDLIEAAADEAHRDFGPKVGRFLGDGLARVTGGRYQQVWLDPKSLRVTVEVPETRRPEDVERLSRGTRAAAYLLLRIGLAQHMSNIGESIPFILDDPLLDLDDARLELFLDLLLHLAGSVQILLFTKDELIKAWFDRHCKGATPHSLTPLQPALLEPVAVNGSDEAG